MAFRHDFFEFLERGTALFANYPGLTEDVEIRFFPSEAPEKKGVRGKRHINVQILFEGGFKIREQVVWNKDVCEKLCERIEEKIQARLEGLQQQANRHRDTAKRALENAQKTEQEREQTRMLSPAPLEELAMAAQDHDWDLDAKDHSAACMCDECAGVD